MQQSIIRHNNKGKDTMIFKPEEMIGIIDSDHCNTIKLNWEYYYKT